MLKVRPAGLDDADAIAHLNGRNGMGSVTAAAWREFRETYPFAAEFRDVPIGWVLEADGGKLVGNLDNVHTMYELQERRLKGVVAAGWVVDREYRGKSLQLMTTFFRQKGVDLWLNVSASPAAAQILTAMKIPRIPIPDYGTPCFWAVRPRAFARAALLRKSIPAAELLAWPLGFALLTRDIFLRSGRRRSTFAVRRLGDFDDRFDEFRRPSKRLRAVRTKAVLEWRFGSELRAGRAVIVVAEQGADLLGYAILVRREGGDLGMDLYDVSDLQAAGDDQRIITDLLVSSIKIAREDGADAIKFMSGTPVTRAPADLLRPYTYRLPLWQQYFKASPELAAELATADAWDFSRFDVF